MPFSRSPDELWAKSSYSVKNAAPNDGAVRTVTPDTGERAYVDWILPSWSAEPTITDLVTVTIDGTGKFTWRPGVVESVQGPQLFGPWYGAVDEVIVISITNDTGTTASLSIKYRENATIS